MDRGSTTVSGLDLQRQLSTAVKANRSRNGSQAGHYGRVLVPIPRVDPICWLASQTGADRMYWAGRADGESVASVGCVASVEEHGPADFSRLRRRVGKILGRAPAGTRLYGGVRFGSAADADEAWSAFPTVRFVLPRFELRSRKGSCLLVCNLGPDEHGFGSKLAREIRSLEPPSTVLPDLPRIVSRLDSPGRRDWVRDIEWALEAFSSTTLAKVVLARMSSFTFDADLDPLALLKRLQEATPSCYHFLFGRNGSTFLGATPEQLFRQDGRRIESEAVAGTGPRGETEGDDMLLSDELLHSEKDQREHEYVRQSIKEALTDITRMLHVDTTASDMKLSVGRHLVSRVSGILRPDVDAFDLLERLHPTPAVGGYPYREAIDVIEHLESFDRGWYAGPVGWIGRDSAEFAVGIRSGRVSSGKLDLFSGAGIVCGSDPLREWEEVEQKIGDFLRVLAP